VARCTGARAHELHRIHRGRTPSRAPGSRPSAPTASWSRPGSPTPAARCSARCPRAGARRRRR
jgi:hypothetical protein